METAVGLDLTDRQRREIAYHREHARKAERRRAEPVDFDVVENPRRRWWNAYWSTYTILRRHDLRGKRVLVPGCGFGEDAIRLARLGAEVHAFDISPEMAGIAQDRVRHLGVRNVRIGVMASEALDYPAGCFDHVFLIDILHHVDIPRTMAELKRVLKPGGWIVGDELYTHGLLQRYVRGSWVVRRFLYSAMRDYIYGGQEPYITEDEHKIDEREFAVISDACASFSVSWYNFLTGRVFPDSQVALSQADRLMLKAMGPAGRYVAGRAVFEGRLPG